MAPRYGRTELECDAGDAVFDPGGFDRAGLAWVDFDDVRLGKGGEAGVVREAIVRVGPHRTVGAEGKFVYFRIEVELVVLSGLFCVRE